MGLSGKYLVLLCQSHLSIHYYDVLQSTLRSDFGLPFILLQFVFCYNDYNTSDSRDCSHITRAEIEGEQYNLKTSIMEH